MKIRDYIRACVWFVRRLQAARRWGIDPTLSSFEWWAERAQKARDDVFRAAIVALHFKNFTDFLFSESMNDYITKACEEASKTKQLSYIRIEKRKP